MKHHVWTPGRQGTFRPWRLVAGMVLMMVTGVVVGRTRLASMRTPVVHVVNAERQEMEEVITSVFQDAHIPAFVQPSGLEGIDYMVLGRDLARAEAALIESGVLEHPGVYVEIVGR